MKIPHRCSRCYARRALRYHWTTYPKPITCAQCGYSSFYVDKTRQARDNSSAGCGCGAYHYTHRKGSGECIFGPNPYGMTKTPETGGWALSEDESLPF